MPGTTFSVFHWVFYSFCRQLFRLYFNYFGGIEVIGWDRVPSSGPLLLASTHSSLADPWLMLVACKRPFRSLAARELFSIWWLGWFLKGMAAFPVSRGQQDASAIAEARRWLSEGAVIVVYPEGRCSPDDGLLPIQPGVALIAVRSQVPVVPVVIRDSNKMLALHTRWPKRHRVQVEFGHPLQPPAREGKVREQIEGLRQQIEMELLRLKALPGEGKGSPI